MKVKLAILTLVISACSRNEVAYTASHSIDPAGWHQDSVVAFAVPVEDTVASYEVVVSLRTNNAYPYQNLYTFRSIASERGTELADTAEYPLADATGRWLGSGVGELKTHDFVLRNQPLRFRKTGVYTFAFAQGIRDTLLPGIEDIVLTLNRVKSEP